MFKIKKEELKDWEVIMDNIIRIEFGIQKIVRQKVGDERIRVAVFVPLREIAPTKSDIQFDQLKMEFYVKTAKNYRVAESIEEFIKIKLIYLIKVYLIISIVK